MKNIQKFVIIVVFLNFNFNLCYSQKQQCDNNEFECRNGECIENDELCDGNRDCADGSDETVEKCLHLHCPKYSFKCSYGACVHGSAVCNKIKDCDDNSDEIPRICDGVTTPTPTTCDYESFKCDNGQCILNELACDGKKDCPDASDETMTLCTGSFCPIFAFRCGYGACINAAEKCNGVNDCIDGSDESNILCPNMTTTQPTTTERTTTTVPTTTTERTTTTTERTTTTTEPTTTTERKTTTEPTTTPDPLQLRCLVTYKPNLIITLEGANPKEVLPGNFVGNFGVVSYSCLEGHLLIGPTENHCFDGAWSDSIPDCKKYCSNSVLRSITIQSTCAMNGTTVSCRLPILPGTKATIACQFGYQKIILYGQDTIHCGNNGEWDYPPYRCQQVCGEDHPDFKPFILGGTTTNNTKVPWHVGIYSSVEKSNEQICGGTIVSARIVISAAHCFWNMSNSQVNDKSLYKVGAGKYYRDYNAKEPLPVQFADIAEIHVTDDYKDVQLSYISDICVLVLTTYLEFTYYIKPACVKWEQYGAKAIKSNIIGRVAGWGKTETGSASKELNTVELSTLSYVDCLDNTQKEYKNLITGDKFCVSSKNGQTVCQGDSGGGFLIPAEDKTGVKRFVLQGIVSNGINSNDECTGDFLTAYTNIQYFQQMVESYMEQFKVD